MKKNVLILKSIMIICLIINISLIQAKESTKIVSTRFSDVEEIVINKGETKLVYSTIKLTAGNLKVKGNAKELMEGEFKYPDLDLRPKADYSENTEIGTLNIELTKPNIDFDEDDQIEWDILLNNDVAMDLTIKMGAGIGNFYLGELNLQDLDISAGAGDYFIDLRNSNVPQMMFKAGAGEASIDLSGERTNSLNAEFTCGFGELKITLPRNIGVRVKISGLIGDVDYPGFIKDKNEYTNDLFRKTETNIDLEITAGMGEIDLMMTD